MLFSLSTLLVEMQGLPPLLWLQKHWGNADHIDLSIQSPVGPWLLKSGAAPLQCLLLFSLHLWGDTGHLGQSCIVFLTFLLLQPPRLARVCLYTPMSMALPPLKALKHLILCHDSFDDAACSAISELQQLQTLHLMGRCGSANVTECAPLQLPGLSQLQDVAICHMIVRGGQISLPPKCSLHVNGEQPVISSLYWETSARIGQVETLYFVHWI